MALFPLFYSLVCPFLGPIPVMRTIWVLLCLPLFCRHIPQFPLCRLQKHYVFKGRDPSNLKRKVLQNWGKTTKKTNGSIFTHARTPPSDRGNPPPPLLQRFGKREGGITKGSWLEGGIPAHFGCFWVLERKLFDPPIMGLFSGVRKRVVSKRVVSADVPPP